MSKGRILVTGAAGYIGSVLCRALLAEGYEVRGLDVLLFGGESLLEIAGHPRFEFIRGDVRDPRAVREALEGATATVHLAAYVGDKAVAQAAEAATEVMDAASKALCQAAASAGLEHFVFASTCSNYGLMEGAQNPLLDEDAPLQPQSLYARLKVRFEQHLLENAALPRTILRFATVYGLSPRIRFDLTVNHFTKDLALGRELLVFGADTWRPYCHVKDLVRSILLVLAAGPAPMDGKVYNVGDSAENYTKRSIVAAIAEQMDASKASFRDLPGQDLRNYRIDFSRIGRELGFRIEKRVPDGIREVARLVRSGLLADPDDPKYRNA